MISELYKIVLITYKRFNAKLAITATYSYRGKAQNGQSKIG